MGKRIDCKFWEDCGLIGGGCCNKGVFGGSPSFGYCVTQCQHRQSETPRKHIRGLSQSGPVEAIRQSEKRKHLMANPVPYPEGRFEGRGVVTCAGGTTYFTCVNVMIGLLRESGCNLPVEVWHLGVGEMDKHMREVLEAKGVVVRNAWDRTDNDPPPLQGWEMKAYAVAHSAFREVIFLDADNIPIKNPEKLFDDPEYKEKGSLFFLDTNKWCKATMWEVMGIPVGDTREFETGQFLVDKARCWDQLRMAMLMNENSHFYYKYVYGDKDTFRFAWNAYGKPYGLIGPAPKWGGNHSLYHFDRSGDVVFEHRISGKAKWDLSKGRDTSEHEIKSDLCQKYLDDLSCEWSARVYPYVMDDKDKEMAALIAKKKGFIYSVYGDQSRVAFFKPDGRYKVSDGAQGYWSIERNGKTYYLKLAAKDGTHSATLYQDKGMWFGQTDDKKVLTLKSKAV